MNHSSWHGFSHTGIGYWTKELSTKADSSSKHHHHIRLNVIISAPNFPQPQCITNSLSRCMIITEGKSVPLVNYFLLKLQHRHFHSSRSFRFKRVLKPHPVLSPFQHRLLLGSLKRSINSIVFIYLSSKFHLILNSLVRPSRHDSPSWLLSADLPTPSTLRNDWKPR